MTRLRPLLLLLMLAGLVLGVAPAASAAAYAGTVDVTVSGLTVTATASVTPAPNNYRFQWGDGAKRAYASSKTATHTYAKAGTYTVTVDVGAGGRTYLGVASKTVTVGQPTNQPPVADAGPDATVKVDTDVQLTGKATDDGSPSGALGTLWEAVSGPAAVPFSDPYSLTSVVRFSAAGDYVLRLKVSDGAAESSDTVTYTAEADAPVDPPASGYPTPYGAGSVYQSSTAGLPVDQALTAEFHQFMGTEPDQAKVPYPKINQNPGWSGHNFVQLKSAPPAPVWKLVGPVNQDVPQIQILRTQGMHIADSVLRDVPTGTQDRLLVVEDYLFGYAAQFADIVPNFANHTLTASVAGVFWHDSNGLDSRAPGGDTRNWDSRGRNPSAMQIPRAELDAATAAGTGLGREMHLFFVNTGGSSYSPCYVFPFVGCEGKQDGWGAEGDLIGIRRDVDLRARGLTGELLTIALTGQENGWRIGDNSGGATQIKVGDPKQYDGTVGTKTNLTTDGFRGYLTWDDFVVYKRP